MKKIEAAASASPSNASRMLAVTDGDGVLIDRVSSPTDAQWNASAKELRFEHGFDNALHRYRLVEFKPDRFRFEPVGHPKDEAKENHELIAPIVGPLARIVLALGTNKPVRQDDLDKVAAFLNTFDGALS